MFPLRIMRQVSEISYVGNFKLIRMASGHDKEAHVTIPLQFNDSHWKNIFEKYDLDGDGKISYQELKAMVHGTTYNDDIPKRVVRLIMQKADLNDSGYLEYPEFIAMIHRKDMQGVFGHFLTRYVHKMVPQRPCLAIQSLSADFTDGQYEEEYSCRPPAIAMILISVIEICSFMYDAFENKSSPVQGTIAQLLIYDPAKKKEIWRYMTYMFVHIGPLHLIVNLIVQVMLGIPLEMVHKWWRVLIIYLAGVVAGSLGTSVSDPHTALAGASGGVYALITAHVATIIMNWRQMEFALLQLCVFIVITICDVGQAIYNRYFIYTKDDRIGYMAHLAGAIAGLLVGINVLRNLEVKTWEKFLWWASIFVYTILMAIAILYNVFYENKYGSSLW